MHSILIPHRNRNEYLDLCLWSIRKSAAQWGVEDWEVVIAEHGSDVCPEESEHVRVVVDSRPMPTVTVDGRTVANAFCKPRLQNVAIAAAFGDVLTFLDCDALVGPKFMAGVRALYDDPTIARLCYRVRRLPRAWLDRFREAGEQRRAVVLDGMFEQYNAKVDKRTDLYEMAWEAYRFSECDRFDDAGFWERGDGWAAGEVHGNSQFSIRRDMLGPVRPDEAYVGRGMEDIAFNRDIHRLHGERYKGFIRWGGEWNMFHLKHPYNDKAWADNGLKRLNGDRFRATRCEF